MADIAPAYPDKEAQEKADHGLDTEFKRGRGLFSATMVVVGSMIGSGIFLVSADMGRLIGSPVDPAQMLEALRGRGTMETALGVGGPNSGLSVRLPVDALSAVAGG